MELVACVQREYTVGETKNRLEAFADECPDPPQDLFADRLDSNRCLTSICASCIERLCWRRYASSTVVFVICKM